MLKSADRSSRIRHRNALTERAWKDAVQGLGKTRLTLNSPSCKRKSSAINGRLPSPIIIAFLFSLSAICRASRGSLTEEAKPQSPEEIATTCYRETRRTLSRKVYVQGESVSPSIEESNGTVSNYIVNNEKKNVSRALRLFLC